MMQLDFILSFTRQSMLYQTDYAAYKQESLTFYAEETWYYKHSDCEDRSVLFYQLVKEVLGLEVVLLDYPEHASAAVLLDEVYGDKPIVYKAKVIQYVTRPDGNHLKTGEYPDGLEYVQYSLILNE